MTGLVLEMLTHLKKLVEISIGSLHLGSIVLDLWLGVDISREEEPEQSAPNSTKPCHIANLLERVEAHQTSPPPPPFNDVIKKIAPNGLWVR